MKIIKKILIGLLITLATLLAAGFIVVRYYEDDVVSYAVSRINESLTTKADVASVDLTFWKTFPLASLRFRKVLIEETFAEKDTLFYADELFLEFSLYDIFDGKYEIKEIETGNAKGYFRIDEKGNDNWHIFRKTEGTDTAGFKLDLKAIGLSATRVVFENRQSRFFIDLTSDKTKAKGNFSGDQFDLDVDLDGILHSLISGNTEYSSERKIELETLLDANTKSSSYRIKDAKVELDGLPFDVAGNITGSAKTTVNLSIRGEELNLGDVLEHLPVEMTKSIQEYEPDGIINFIMTISGETGTAKKPSVDLSLDVVTGSMRHKESGVTIRDIEGRANYLFSSKKDELIINGVSAKLDEGIVEMSGSIHNLSKIPSIDFAVRANLDLTALRNFLALDTLEVCEGKLSLNTSLSGVLLRGGEEKKTDWTKFTTNGSAEISNCKIRLKESSREFSRVSATLLFNNQAAAVQQLTGEVNGSDFEINGTVTNLLPFLANENEQLSVDAKLHCKLLDFTNLIETANSTAKDEDYSFALPKRINFRLNTSIDHFRFRKFEANNLQGMTSLQNQILKVDPVSLSTADGDFLAQLGIRPVSDEQFQVDCSASLSGINIQKLFAEFENFGQEFITDQHLRGKATANVNFSAPLSRSFEIKSDNIKSLIDISIENGELINLASLQEVAAYIKKNKLVAPFVNEEKFAEKLKDIKFSNLENTIDISNRTITIPQMSIRSTVMDIVVRGTHTFDNAIDYGLGFSLRDILIRKDNTWNEADDGLGKKMYIYMKGTVANPQFGIDKTMGKETRQQEMESEKQNMKALLKDEFGLFKGDKSIGAYQSKEEPAGSTTNIQWEEFDNKTPAELPKKTEKKPNSAIEQKPGKKVPRWLQEKESQEDKEP